jgi:outer membrane protein OmpA-like peptidoglycan-associated protein
VVRDGAAGALGLDALLARSVATRASSGRLLQRFHLKPRLESPDLNSERLQKAVASAEQALNVNVDEGEAVVKLQAALSKAGFAAPDTGKYDSDTQRACAGFQKQQEIPFPTGRQAGPKTLSALDDVLLKAKPDDKKDCAKYEQTPDERAQSIVSRGDVLRTGSLLTLSNFAAGKSQMKRQHEDALRDLIREFDLASATSRFHVQFIHGFTDGVDAEEENVLLREARAADVQFVLNRSGVKVPDGTPADPKDYDAGCTPKDRSFARRVEVKVTKNFDFSITSHAFRITAKSFIRTIGSQTGRLFCGPSRIEVTPQMNNLAAATDALMGETAPTDARDGKYRMFSRATIVVECLGGRPVRAHFSPPFFPRNGVQLADVDTDNGLEGPLETPRLIVFDKNVSNGPPFRFSWGVKGRPALAAEPGFQLVCPRTSRLIWHRIQGELDCNGLKNLTLTGSHFPTHRVFVDGALEGTIPQGPFSNLWVPDAADPTMVR